MYYFIQYNTLIDFLDWQLLLYHNITEGYCFITQLTHFQICTCNLITDSVRDRFL